MIGDEVAVFLSYKQVDKNVQKSIWILSKTEHFGGA